ncbi:Shedu immune nuclease family protein [Streptomyces hydrogenans]|uniref:Shedu immune nuclease family protein n=1 Tax=Streptomyces hydrogenans TaxID=1873719 RepID=UPI00382672A9
MSDVNSPTPRLRRPFPQTVIKDAFALSAGRCAFPDCQTVTLDNGVPLLEVAQISSRSAGGPRYSPPLEETEGDLLDNIIILCPTHHAAVDRNPETFTSEALVKMRDAHFARVRSGLSSEQRRTTSSRLADLLEVWERNRSSGDEEFWQQLFSDHPEAFSLALEGRAYTLSSKCYVGGKSVDNRGGNVLDFLARHSANSALVEIKTPSTKLLDPRKYRGNVHAPSRELAGSTVQVLEYRHSLISNLPALAYETPGLRVTQPMGVVIIGDLEKEQMGEGGRRSFELYRSSFRDLKIMTYDEVFGGIRMLVDILKE